MRHYSLESDGLCCRLTVNLGKHNVPHRNDADEWEIDRQTISLVRRIGDGKSGEVWEGLWNGTTTVAVKTPKLDKITNEEFLFEARLLKKLQHKNIIKLYAVCSRVEYPIMVMEVMKHGRLVDYLQKHNMKTPQLIDMAAQVACGMAYLGSQHYIHRDLIARNILVTEGNIVKIANFGMARVIETGSAEYIGNGIEKFPVKWAAPEVFFFHRFSVKSDVWSFGIVLTELITNGRTPYPGITNRDVLVKVEQGYRMPPPPGCPDQLHQIMMDCWKWDPKERPTFEYLRYTLEDFYVVSK